ncbi:Retrovirus-related Pol polyprotein from transposon RE1 [Sesamum angolense]|uniref:Retrovirus-related Pol polyprotein from transposon RE1 n=1 Tax=Sesamum angolense TaxID=2727404 RepID=A0AAE2C3L7_9LAMI|nr:Retrovirus-related Pol polyprotein from transposon RE1 [Sesamum angolense]
MILSLVGPTFFESTPFYSPQSSLIIPPTSVPLPVPTLCVPPHTEPPTRPLQVYSRRNHPTNTTLTAPPGLPPTTAPGNPSATPVNDLLLLFRKVKVWKMAMDDEMYALISRGTWELVEAPPNADVVACRWVFTLKFRADGTLERYKARLVAKGFAQTHGCQSDHLVFVQTTKSGVVVLAVYVDDILITGSDVVGIEEANTYLQKHFVTKDLGRPRPDISFAVGLVNPFMDKLRSVHWEAALRILKYYARSKNDRKSTSGYYTYVGGNLVTWRSKKQTIVARSSAEAEYRAMAHTTSEILWLKNLLKELSFMYDDPIPMHCDNQAAIHIASNPIFHERTKHIEIDCHFVHEAIMSQKICTPFTPSEQRADIFTKALGAKQFDVA